MRGELSAQVEAEDVPKMISEDIKRGQLVQLDMQRPAPPKAKVDHTRSSTRGMSKGTARAGGRASGGIGEGLILVHGAHTSLR